LRARPDDIPLLVEHILGRGRHLYPKCGSLTEQQIKQLQSYGWPGNIRELRNVLERAVIISQGGPLRLDLALGNGTAGKPSQPTQDPRRSNPFSFLTQEMTEKGVQVGGQIVNLRPSVYNRPEELALTL